jgi:hypothetical protein
MSGDVEAVGLFAECVLEASVTLMLQRANESAALLLDTYTQRQDRVLGVLVDAARAVVKENIMEVMAEWSELVEANVGEGWTRQCFNTQAVEQALLVVERAAGVLRDEVQA